MRALVVTSNPATAVSEPDSPASALNDLGCEIVAHRHDPEQFRYRLLPAAYSLVLLIQRELRTPILLPASLSLV